MQKLLHISSHQVLSAPFHFYILNPCVDISYAGSCCWTWDISNYGKSTEIDETPLRKLILHTSRLFFPEPREQVLYPLHGCRVSSCRLRHELDSARRLALPVLGQHQVAVLLVFGDQLV